MKKNYLKTGAALLAIMLALAGCGKSGDDAQTATNNYEPYGKFDSEVSLTAVKSMTSEKFADGDDISNNVWTRSYKDDLNVKVNYMWTVPESQYDQKLNITIASGDLPDAFTVSPKQYKELVAAGKVQDITEAFEKTATDNLRKVIDANPMAKEFNSIDGKMMGFSSVPSSYDAADLIWIRTDWLKKLGLEAPKTMDDLNNIILAFANNDPDGNGEKDTYGLAMCKMLESGIGGVQGYMAGYHAYLNMWYDRGDGKLVYGSVQPEMKEALLALQNLKKQGAINPEFGVKDTDKIQEDLGASKVGVSIGAMWQPNSGMKSVIELNENADWMPYGLVSIDDKTANTMVESSPKGYLIVREGFKYPEAVVKMLNLYVDRYIFPESLEISEKYAHGDGMEYFKYATFQMSYAKKNLDIVHQIRDALQTGDTSKLTPPIKKTYDQVDAYVNGGNRAMWSPAKISGPGGAFDIIDLEYVANDRIKQNAYYDMPTKTMSEKLSTLEKMQDEVFTKIILGDDISNFDKFVEDWMRLGGEQMTKEVNEWYDSKK